MGMYIGEFLKRLVIRPGIHVYCGAALGKLYYLLIETSFIPRNYPRGQDDHIIRSNADLALVARSFRQNCHVLALTAGNSQQVSFFVKSDANFRHQVAVLGNEEIIFHGLAVNAKLAAAMLGDFGNFPDSWHIARKAGKDNSLIPRDSANQV